MLAMTKKELADVVGYTYRRIYEIDAQLPNEAKLYVKTEGNRYDLAIFVQRWVQYNINKEIGGDTSLEEVKALHEGVKMEKSKIELAKMRGDVVSIQDIHRIWGDIATTVMQHMIHLPSKVAPMVVMMDNVGAISSIIDREVRAALTMIAETPLPEYVQRQADTEAGDEDDKEGDGSL